MQHIHNVNQCRSSTQAPNVRSVLQHSTFAVANERSSSRQAPNIRGVLQCSTFTLSIKDVVQHKTAKYKRCSAMQHIENAN